jgi:hypothetical protein
MGQELMLVNLEECMPKVEQAKMRLDFAIQNGRARNVIVLKVIHGYGSSGVGGRIKIAVKETLTVRKRQGGIKLFVNGEDWTIFNEKTREILERCPSLRRDNDLENYNPGITIVMLR